MRFGSVGENVDRLTGAVVLRLHVDARKRKRRPARAGGNAADFAGKHDIGDLRRRRTVRRGIENAGLFAPDRQATSSPSAKPFCGSTGNSQPSPKTVQPSGA